MTLHFGEWPWIAHHFACPSVPAANLWQGEIKKTVASSNFSTSCGSTETWLQRVYTQLKQTYGDKLHAANILATFSKERIWKSYKVCYLFISGS